MRIHESAENYLECILILSRQKPRVRSIDVVNYMGVTKPTVSYTMKQFRENGYINMDEDGYITLTPKAMKIAQKMLERHNTIARLLIYLGVDEDTAFEDACKIEHDISDVSFNRMKEYLTKITE